MPAPLTPARLEFDAQGIPISSQYGDVFHAAAGALAQAQHVFLQGNGLPGRWQGRHHFTIVETGFGLGHNFLATWAAFRADPAACARLHFVSVEKHPFVAKDLSEAHHRAGVPADLSAALCAQWPLAVPGFHRIEFDAGRVVLTLLFGEAAELLPQLSGQADAIYLDGFAPSCNPDMWSPAVLAALRGLAVPGATLATWSVAAYVRHGLGELGFTLEKRPGFAGKRDMLAGHLPGTPDIGSTAREALVIGAGLAGCGIAERLATRGWQVTLLDAAASPAQGASGNIAGAFRPQPSADDNWMAQITRAGFTFALAHLERLRQAGHPVRWDACGVLHLARDARHAEKQKAALALLQPPAEFMYWVEREEASAIAGVPCAQGGWFFPYAGWVQPGSLCAANLAMAGERVDTRFNTRVERIQRSAGLWQALDDNGHVLASAPHLVLANAHDARRLAGADWLPLFSARGQVSHLPPTAVPALKTVVCGQGYITPPIDGTIPTGASFVVDAPSLALNTAEHAENLAKLATMLPDYATRIDPATLEGRVGLRPISPDRLPYVDVLPDSEELYVLSAFGARGLVWGGLCADLLASRMEGEVLPLPESLVKAMSVKRYL